MSGALLLALLALGPPAAAYQITSAFTNPCHEAISLAAYNNMLGDIDTSQVPLPKSEVWQKLARRIQQSLGVQLPTPQDELVLVSLVIGTRAPDTDGHSIANFVQLRAIHLAQGEEQYHHALRAPDDDDEAGNAAAIAGTRAWIKEISRRVSASLQRPPDQQIVRVTIFLDFYGRFEVEVWEPAFLLGVAAHALQDTFTHMLRSRDTRTVFHVLNYADPVAGEYDETRDGLAHSDALDDCSETGPVRELARSAATATEDLFRAMRAEIRENKQGELDAMLAKWLTLKPGCTIDNNYCDCPWLDTAKRKLSGPYLCQAADEPISDPWRQLVLPWALLFFAGLLLARRLRRPKNP
jgi:hypothetical protein